MKNLPKLSATQSIAAAFTVLILMGTGLLMLPISSSSGKSTNFFDALLTSTSSFTVTGLASVDTGTHWSTFGHVVIAFGVQIGGIGIIAFATLVAFLLEGKISMKSRTTVQAESSAPRKMDIKSYLKTIVKMLLIFQSILFAILAFRFFTEYDYSLDKAITHGAFHSLMTVNHAGFALYADSMIGFAQDPWIILSIFVFATIASLGIPVLVEIRDRIKVKLYNRVGKDAGYTMPRHWSLNSRIVLWATLFLTVVGTLGVTIAEWNNPATLGAAEPLQKFMSGLFDASMTRTVGFNSIPTGEMDPGSWIGFNILMFIGGASGSTAGGIKIGTAVILIFIVFTEIRGDAAVNVGNRRLPRSMQRQALTIVTLYSAVIIGALFILRFTTNFTTDQLLFEIISSIGTVGLSTGITADLPNHAKFLISLVMLFGRLGPIVVATSLALRRTKRHFEYPRESPLIG
jgi:Trk-type K+ transport system membrane component